MHYGTSIALNVNAMLISIAAKMHQFRIMICHLRRYILFWIDIYCNCKKGTCLSGPCNDGKCCRRFITLSLYQASYKPESTNLWYEHIRTQIYLISSYLFNPSNFDSILIFSSYCIDKWLLKNLWVHSKNRNIGSNILQNWELLISVLITMIGFQNAISVCNGWTGNNHISRTIQTETQSI